jgi:hypothetical protein
MLVRGDSGRIGRIDNQNNELFFGYAIASCIYKTFFAIP